MVHGEVLITPLVWSIVVVLACGICLGAAAAPPAGEKPNDVGIRPSASGRYFVDLAAGPFFWNGDTQWELWRKHGLDEAKLILDKQAAAGFNVFQVFLVGNSNGTEPNAAGEKPWIGSPATPNPKYFDTVDAVVEYGRAKGLIFVIGITHSWIKDHPPATAKAWAKWIAARYKDVPNIIWVPSYTATPDMLRTLAAGLQEGDGGRHLITYHPDPSPLSSKPYHNEPWLAFDCMQTWAYHDKIYPMITELYRMAPTKPVVNAEGAYEEGPEYGFAVTPLWVRRQAWWAVLAGGFTSYGHNDNWRVGPKWRAALEAPGAAQCGVMRKFFESLAWWDLVPDQSLLAGPAAGKAPAAKAPQNVAARSAKGEWAVAYIGTAGPVTIALVRSPPVARLSPPGSTRRPARGRRSETFPPRATSPSPRPPAGRMRRSCSRRSRPRRAAACMERAHSPMIFTSTRFRRLPSNSP